MADKRIKSKQQEQEKERFMPKVNFKAVASGGFPARPAGDYEVTFVGYQLNAASQSGFPTVRLDWSENDSPNKKIMKTYSLQPQALWSLKRDMIRMGADVEQMNSEDADLEEILDALIGSVSTIIMGEPREAKDTSGNLLYVDPSDPAGKTLTTVANDNQKFYDNFKEIKDPQKVGV